MRKENLGFFMWYYFIYLRLRFIHICSKCSIFTLKLYVNKRVYINWIGSRYFLHINMNPPPHHYPPILLPLPRHSYSLWPNTPLFHKRKIFHCFWQLGVYMGGRGSYPFPWIWWRRWSPMERKTSLSPSSPPPPSSWAKFCVHGLGF